MNQFLETYGAPLFLGLPLICYMAQALLVYRPQHRYGMALMFVAYAIALAGSYMDSKGI